MFYVRDAPHRIWDLRMLRNISRNLDDEDAPITPPPSSPGAPEDGNNSVGTDETLVFDSATVSEYTQSKRGEGCLRGEWRHDKSVSSAYWDPRGRSIVSTSYDDTLRRELFTHLVRTLYSILCCSLGFQSVLLRKEFTVPISPPVQSSSA